MCEGLDSEIESGACVKNIDTSKGKAALGVLHFESSHGNEL